MNKIFIFDFSLRLTGTDPLKILISRTTWQISIKLGRKHSWVKEIQICSNERPRPFPERDNNVITKKL